MSMDNFARYFKEVEKRRLSKQHKERMIRAMRSLFPKSRWLNGDLFGGKPMISKSEFIDWMYVRGFTIEVMRLETIGENSRSSIAAQAEGALRHIGTATGLVNP